MEEIWKAIPGWESLYEASSLGRIRSLPRMKRRREGLNNNAYHLEPGRILKQCRNNKGYYSVHLSLNGISSGCLVHRLVAMAFIPNDNNLPQINHKDENPSNNKVDNLEWCDNQYNNTYGNKYNNEVMVIRISPTGEEKKYKSARSGAKDTHTNLSNIISCCKGKRNKAGGYKWQYGVE